jgi:hypothetical protein
MQVWGQWMIKSEDTFLQVCSSRTDWYGAIAYGPASVQLLYTHTYTHSQALHTRTYTLHDIRASNSRAPIDYPVFSLWTYLHIDVSHVPSLFSDGPTTIHTTHYPEAWPGTLSLARLIRRNDERIRLQERRPTVVDIFLHNWKEIVDLWKDTSDTLDNEALKVLPECAPSIYLYFAPI